MRTVFYYSVCSISQIDQRCLITEENNQVCVGSTSHGNLQEKRDLCGERRGDWCCDEEGCTGGTGWMWLLYQRAQTLGAHSGLLQVPSSARQPGLFPCSSHPRQKLLSEPTSALLLLCSPAAMSPSCHPSISALISLYHFSVPSEVLFPSLLLHTSSIFLIINVILIQQIPECHNLPVNLSQRYLWRHTSSEMKQYWK